MRTMLGPLAALAGVFCLNPLAPSQPPAPQVPPQATIAQKISKERLIEVLRRLPASRAALGDVAAREGLVKTEVLLEGMLKEAGVAPTLHEFTWALPARNFGSDPDAAKAPAPELHPWHNIVVDLPGTDLAAEVLLVSAHMDAVPGSPGADDDGTGTAAIVELARVFANTHHRRTIRLCLFNLEEVGLIGSTRYVLDWKQAKSKAVNPGEEKPNPERIIGMVSLEMLGYFSDAPNSQKSPIPAIKGVFDPPTVGDNIILVGINRDSQFIQNFAREMRQAAPGLKVGTVDFLAIPAPDMLRSDHRGFILAGIPGAMLTDTANFRNPNYHQPTDTVETLDLDRYTLVVQGVAGAIDALAEPAR